MPAQPISDEKLREAVLAVAQFGGVNPAARQLGIPRQTLQNRLKRAEQRGISTISEPQPIEFPAFVTEGDEEEDIEDLLARREKHFDRKWKAASARQWFEIKVKETQPATAAPPGPPAGQGLPR